MGCGWAHIPFIESSRFQITNKSYDLILNGGSVFDKNVPLDPNLASKLNVLILKYAINLGKYINFFIYFINRKHGNAWRNYHQNIQRIKN